MNIKRIVSFSLILLFVLSSIALYGCSKDERTPERGQAERESAKTYADYTANAVLQYPTRDETFRYTIYDTYVEISEYLASAEKVVIPDTFGGLPVISVRAQVFDGNKNIKQVVFGANIMNVGDYCFRNCTSLTTVDMNGKLEILGASVFSGCEKLKYVILPASLNSVPTGTFFGCTHLKRAVVEQGSVDTEKIVNDNAFGDCPALRAIWIPANTGLNAHVFGGSTGRAPIIYGEVATSAARLAALDLHDFVITERDEFENIARKYEQIEDEALYIGIGETTTLGDFRITLDSAQLYNKLGPLQGDKDYLYAVFRFTVRNTGKKQAYFNGLDVECLTYGYDADKEFRGYEKHPVCATADSVGFNYPCGLIGAGNELTGGIIIKLLKNTEAISVSFDGAADIFRVRQ